MHLNNKTSDDLRYIIRWTDKKDEAGAQLLKQEPTNDDLRYIIERTDKKDEAALLLRERIGVKDYSEEDQIKEIADIVLADPSKLVQERWHCGTSHCIAGWLCMLNEDANNVEKEFGTEFAGQLFLPSYSHLFHKDNITVLLALKSLLTNS